MTTLFNKRRERLGIIGGANIGEPIRNYDIFDPDDNGNLTFVRNDEVIGLSNINEGLYLGGGGGGSKALECNLTGRCPLFKNLHNPFRKKFAFQYPVSELLDYKNFQNNRETIVYYS